MQDNEETCLCGYSLDQCKVRQRQHGKPGGEVSENSDGDVWWEGDEPPEEVQLMILALHYACGKLEILPDGVRFRDA